VTLNRKDMYRLPYSKTDNAGGWVEVTDECDLCCAGCYRQKLEGHRRLEEVKQDILTVGKMTNCDRIAVAGGEPLVYPHIVDVVNFISENGMKPALITNGEKLTRELAAELKKAGLIQYYIHVDSGMKRPGWGGKNEIELNELRQYFADLVWDVGGVQCGFNTTVFRSTLEYLPDIINWGQRNIQKVSHISAIAYRAVPLTNGVEYVVNGKTVDAGRLQFSSEDVDEIKITAEELYELLRHHFADYYPCTFMSGTAVPESYTHLFAVRVGSKRGMYGYLGGKTVELVQTFHHFFTGKYVSFFKRAGGGRKLFLLSVFDKQLKRAFANYLKTIIGNPLTLFDKIYVQVISLQQPNELLDGKANLCEGCLNLMLYKGELIESCRLDEYRLFGGPLTPVLKSSVSASGNKINGFLNSSRLDERRPCDVK
jgi:hypothetical protein